MRLLAPQREGIIGLVTVIVVGVMVLITGIAASYVGQTDTIVSGHNDRDLITRNLAESCLEEAFYRLKKDAAYAGGTVPVGSDTCMVAVSGGGATRTITVTAIIDDYTKSLTVSAVRQENAAANARGWKADSYVENDPP